MGARRWWRQLTLGAGVLLVAQALLLRTLLARPLAPDRLPEVETELRSAPLAGTVTESEGPAGTVALLDRLLAARVADAAARQGRDAAAYTIAPAVRAAALADPRPDGPAVEALLAAYSAQLASLGERLDADPHQ